MQSTTLGKICDLALKPLEKKGETALWPLWWVMLAVILGSPGSSAAQEISKTKVLIDLDSQMGEQLLFTSPARRDYLPLSSEFVTQDHLAYCGVATIVMILNALDVDAPEVASHTVPGLVSYRFFTQENVLENEKTHSVIKAETIKKQGMTLQELGGLFQSYPLDVQVFHGQEVSLDQFRDSVVQNLQQPNNYVAVNYLRRSLGQEGGGHISPIAAYNAESDRFLILDVARYRYEPLWVEAEALWKAINTLDSTSGKSRGFVLISSMAR
ncbi:MAG: phytochelatin synthase family protein [Cyanobacteria bacterium P01_A01_bin.17]